MFVHLRKALAQNLWGVVLDGELNLEKLAKKARRAEDRAKAAGADPNSEGESSKESDESRKADSGKAPSAAKREKSLSEDEEEKKSPLSKTSPASGDETESPSAESKAGTAAPAGGSQEKQAVAESSPEPAADYSRSPSATPEPKAAPVRTGGPGAKAKANAKAKATPAALQEKAKPAAPNLVLKTNEHEARRLEQQAVNQSRDEYLKQQMRAENDISRAKKREQSAEPDRSWNQDKAYERWSEEKDREADWGQEYWKRDWCWSQQSDK